MLLPNIGPCLGCIVEKTDKMLEEEEEEEEGQGRIEARRLGPTHPRREPIWGHAIYFTYSLKRAEYVKEYAGIIYSCWSANQQAET